MIARLNVLLAVGIAVGVVSGIAACMPFPTPTPTPMPTPSFTATVTPTPTATPLPTWTPVPSPVPGVLYVDASADLGEISPLVYGTNTGPYFIVPYEMMDYAVAGRFTFVRYPGGAYGDHFNLEHLDIDKYIALTRQLGAEPHISVRLLDGTPQRAVELLQYTRQQGYNVRYWSIGNEPNLYATMDRRPEYDTQFFNSEWRAIALAMKAVAPDIILIGPDISQFTADPTRNPKDSAGRDWLREFLLANGDLVDIVSVHRYPFPLSVSSGPPTVEDLRRNSPEWDAIIPYLRSVIRETTGRDLPIAITEVNSNWSNAIGGEATPDSFYNAIWLADVLGRLIRNGVDMVGQFDLVRTDRQGGLGLLGRFEPRPSYYVYIMYKNFGTRQVYASFERGDVSIYAARRSDGALTLMVINRGPEASAPTLRLDGFVPAGPATVLRFDAEHPTTAEIDPQQIVDGVTLDLPPQSITLYTLQP